MLKIFKNCDIWPFWPKGEWWNLAKASLPPVRIFLPSFCFYFLWQFILIPLFARGRIMISGASSVISFATESEIQNVRRPTSFPFFFFFLYIPLTKLPSTFRFFIFIFPFILKNIFNNSFRENWWLSFNAWRWRSIRGGLIDSLFTFLFFKLIFFHTFCLRVMLHLLSKLPKKGRDIFNLVFHHYATQLNQ